MGQADFSYTASAANDTALSVSLSIFADRPHVRDTMREGTEEAGFRLLEVGDVATLLDRAAKPIGEVVLLDCPVLDAQSSASRPPPRASHHPPTSAACAIF